MIRHGVLHHRRGPRSRGSRASTRSRPRSTTTWWTRRTPVDRRAGPRRGATAEDGRPPWVDDPGAADSRAGRDPERRTCRAVEDRDERRADRVADRRHHGREHEGDLAPERGRRAHDGVPARGGAGVRDARSQGLQAERPAAASHVRGGGAAPGGVPGAPKAPIAPPTAGAKAAPLAKAPEDLSGDEKLTAGKNDAEERDEHGRWTAGGLAATAHENGGLTLDPRTGKMPTEGYWVAMHPGHEEEDHRQREGRRPLTWRHADVLKMPGSHIGAWYNPEDKKWYLDISHVESDKATAIKLAQTHNQQGIYRPRNRETTIKAAEYAGMIAAAGVDEAVLRPEQDDRGRDLRRHEGDEEAGGRGREKRK